MCYYTYPMWFKFASKYSTSKVQFYLIDISKHQQLADWFKVSRQTQSNQLPTVVLLEDNKECLRFPPIDEKGKQGYVLAWKERELAKYFDLD